VQTRPLGSNGPELSVVGFGSWALGGSWEYGWGAQDDDESIAAIRHAVERGVNWVDTAAVYGHGHSEQVVGRAVQPFAVGEEVLVFTKCGERFVDEDGRELGGLRPTSIREECERSLGRLGLERIDLYQFHWPDPDTPVEESWATMVELVDEGKVRWIGVCNTTVELLERCEAVRHVDSAQPPLNLLNRGAREDVIPWCKDHGTGVIVYSPMASGLLTGTFDRVRIAQLDPNDWRRESPQFGEPALSRTLDLVDRLRRIASRLDATLPELAVAWTLAQTGVTAAIVGARLPRHVDGWARAPELELPPEALVEIAEAVRASGAGTDEPPQPPPHVLAAAGARMEDE
jgi:aryl-alcohol dehydrogenase-like predicted oxidoreductase